MEFVKPDIGNTTRGNQKVALHMDKRLEIDPAGTLDAGPVFLEVNQCRYVQTCRKRAAEQGG